MKEKDMLDYEKTMNELGNILLIVFKPLFEVVDSIWDIVVESLQYVIENYDSLELEKAHRSFMEGEG